jgi:hypothetical protein
MAELLGREDNGKRLRQIFMPSKRQELKIKRQADAALYPLARPERLDALLSVTLLIKQISKKDDGHGAWSFSLWELQRVCSWRLSFCSACKLKP